jgi:cytochrome b involved in lipid metabolism
VCDSHETKAASAPAEYTMADVQAHKTRSDVWFVVHGNAYDVTKFLDEVRRVCACAGMHAGTGTDA